MYYTYNEILYIKKDLDNLISLIEKNRLPLYEKGKHIKEHIKEYDKVLEKIGPNGICSDPELCIGFLKTELLINELKDKLK